MKKVQTGYRFIHTKRATAKYAQRSKKGRATRKGMDGGKGGQTLRLQGREGENRVVWNHP